MNLNYKYCIVKNRLSIEIFLNLCEELGIKWSNGAEPRKYIEEDLLNEDSGVYAYMVVGNEMHTCAIDEIDPYILTPFVC